MRCDDYEILISAAADGDIGPAGMAELTAHLESCESCKREYEETLALQQGLTTVLADCGEAPSLTERVMARVAPRRRPSFRWVWSAAAACAVVIAVMAVVLWPARHESKRQTPVKMTQQAPKQSPGVTKLATGAKPSDKPRLARKSVSRKALPAMRPRTSTVATVRKTTLVPDQQAEVTIEYTDEDTRPAPVPADRQAELPSPPQNRHNGKVVASRTTVIENGERVDRPSYRLVPGSNQGEGDM